jgi:predicted DCC family thiol-disulfide oxidoreductase YuxK
VQTADQLERVLLATDRSDQATAAVDAHPEEIQDTLGNAIQLPQDAWIASQAIVASAGPVAQSVADIAEGWDADFIVGGSSG